MNDEVVYSSETADFVLFRADEERETSRHNGRLLFAPGIHATLAC